MILEMCDKSTNVQQISKKINRNFKSLCIEQKKDNKIQSNYQNNIEKEKSNTDRISIFSDSFDQQNDSFFGEKEKEKNNPFSNQLKQIASSLPQIQEKKIMRKIQQMDTSNFCQKKYDFKTKQQQFIQPSQVVIKNLGKLHERQSQEKSICNQIKIVDLEEVLYLQNNQGFSNSNSCMSLNQEQFKQNKLNRNLNLEEIIKSNFEKKLNLNFGSSNQSPARQVLSKNFKVINKNKKLRSKNIRNLIYEDEDQANQNSFFANQEKKNPEKNSQFIIQEKPVQDIFQILKQKFNQSLILKDNSQNLNLVQPPLSQEESQIKKKQIQTKCPTNKSQKNQNNFQDNESLNSFRNKIVLYSKVNQEVKNDSLEKKQPYIKQTFLNKTKQNLSVSQNTQQNNVNQNHSQNSNIITQESFPKNAQILIQNENASQSCKNSKPIQNTSILEEKNNYFPSKLITQILKEQNDLQQKLILCKQSRTKKFLNQQKK